MGVKEWITGRNPAYEVLRAKRRQVYKILVANGIVENNRITSIFKLAKNIPIEKVPRERLDPLGDNHQGIAIQTSEYPYSTLPDILELSQKRQEPPFVLILDIIQNPQNLGTLLRTAEAVGIHGVLLPKRRAAGVTPAVVNASAGASEHMLLATVNLAQAIDTLKENNIWIVGLEGSAEAQPVGDIPLDGALGLVVGSEGQGMRSLVRRSCDFLAALPMAGKIESLNAAVAGSVILYMAFQTRQKKCSETQ